MTANELATQKMLTSMAKDIAAIKQTVEDDHKAIFGNGQPGLLTRVAKLETKVGIIAGIAGAVTGIVGGCVTELIKHFL
ncbi:MAG: hypothetical protein J5654_09745 [Victivallales bacterium]|nr:hypothetical protein [Victivallales bacterium]